MNVETQTGNARKLSRRELASLSRGNKAAKKASEMLARQTAWEQLIAADAKAQKGATWAAGELRRAVVEILGVRKNTVSLYLSDKYYHHHRSDRLLKAAAAFETALQNKPKND